MNEINKIKNRTARFTKNIFPTRPFRIVKAIFTPWQSGVLVSRVICCRRKTLNPRYRISYFKGPTIWLLRGGGGVVMDDLIWVRIFSPNLCWWNCFFPAIQLHCRSGISWQDFFSLEISLQDNFFSEISHTPPQKSNGRPLGSSWKWPLSARFIN